MGHLVGVVTLYRIKLNAWSKNETVVAKTTALAQVYTLSIKVYPGDRVNVRLKPETIRKRSVREAQLTQIKGACQNQIAHHTGRVRLTRIDERDSKTIVTPEREITCDGAAAEAPADYNDMVPLLCMKGADQGEPCKARCATY
jgi:hypothetical protein